MSSKSVSLVRECIQMVFFLVVLIVLIWSILYFGGITPGGIVVIHSLTALCGFLMVLDSLFSRQLCIPKSVPFYALLLLVVIIFNSQFHSIYYYASHVQCLQYIGLMIFFLSVINLFNSEMVLRSTRIIVIVGAAVALFGIYEYTRTNSILWGIAKVSYRDRVSGTFINPNHFGALLSMIVPLSFYYVLSSVKKVKIFFVVLSIIIGIALILTFSLSSYIGLLGGMLVCLMVNREHAFKNKHTFTAFVVIGAILIVNVITLFLSGIKSYSLHNHWRMLISSLEHIVRVMPCDIPRFLLGYGAGTFRYIVPQFYTELMLQTPIHAHNEFIEFFVELGLIGMTLFTLFWMSVIGSIILKIKRSINGRLYVLCVLGAVISFIIHMLFDFNFHLPANMIVVLMLLAFVQVKHDEKIVLRGVIYIASIGILVCSCVYLLVVPYRYYSAERQVDLLTASRTIAELDEVEQIIVAAIDSAPMNAEVHISSAEIYYHFFRTSIDQDLRKSYQKKALAYFLRAIRLNPHKAQSYVRLADLYAYIGKYRLAADYFAMAIDKAPMQVMPYAKRVEFSVLRPTPDLRRTAADIRFLLDNFHPFIFQDSAEKRAFVNYLQTIIKKYATREELRDISTELDAYMES